MSCSWSLLVCFLSHNNPSVVICCGLCGVCMDYFGGHLCVIINVTPSIFQGEWIFAGGEYLYKNVVLTWVAMSEEVCKKSDFPGR